MSVTFGKRVVGAKEHADAVKKNAGGAAIFGRRVVGALNADNPTNREKANSMPGPRVVGNASESQPDGSKGTISIDDLRNVLAENPTFFDSLYENELALSQGSRKEALEIFLQVELGIKGQGRAHVKNEIRSLLGYEEASLTKAAQDVENRHDRIAAQEQRMEENAALRDLPRIESMQKREDGLKALDKATHAGTRGQLLPETASGQLKAMETEQAGGHEPTTPSKPEGDVKPETQSAVSSARKKAPSAKRK